MEVAAEFMIWLTRSLVVVPSFLAVAAMTAVAVQMSSLLIRTVRVTRRDEERATKEGGAENPEHGVRREEATEPARRVTKAESPLVAELSASRLRSIELAERINQRAGLQFAWGVILSVAGLLGFAALIWLSYIPAAEAVTGVAEPSWTEIAASALPRVALVLSIEILAGYFLRLHRVTMADFHRYERVVEYREQLVTLARWLESEEKLPANLRNQLFMKLLARPDLDLVPAGQTTEGAQAEHASRNDIVETIREGGTAAREMLKATVGRGE